jgi:hypothetical protein
MLCGLAVISGKKEIYLDGRMVYTHKDMFGSGMFEHSFDLPGKKTHPSCVIDYSIPYFYC